MPQWISVVAGTASGALTSVFTAPLDLVRTRQQVGTSPKEIRYLIKEVVSHDGVRGLWLGLTPTLVGLVPTWAIYWSVYQSMKNIQIYDWGRDAKSPWVHLQAAVTAGVATAVATNPIWVVKTRFQTQTMAGKTARYVSIRHSFQVIWKEEGFRGFYKGLTPSLFGVGHVCVQFPLYEYLKIRAADRSGVEVENLATTDILVCSGAAKTIASMAAYPHEVLRSRLQRDRKGVHASLWQLMKHVYATEGPGGFYRGFTTNLIRIVPAAAITFATFEFISKSLTGWTKR